MDRLHLMTVFVAVGEEESFAGGARRLGMSPPAVTRAISALEARLGVKLLQRTTRYVRVTEAGQRYLDDARRILGEVDEADEAAAGINAAPRGHLTVTAPVLFGKMFVMPGIIDYLNRYPEADVSALFLDRVVNMLEEGVDVAVRIGPLPDSSMRAIKVGQVRRVLCASPEYLERHGIPLTPQVLRDRTIIAATGVSPAVEWKFGPESGPANIKLKPRLTVTSNDAAIEAARSGLGITRLMSYQIAPHLATGELKIVLSEYENAPLPIHIVHRESKYGSAKVRSFIDLMVDRLRADKHLN
ncbi:LysR family transcriptional regulator [Chitinimonas viridis]|uniref:LysR family transcriptional regulator n=1 Tax=Chitinimonas viridis TaxID=664880 RepID=A0ABT8B4W8_9NEIS|nr:LysR family transcriptional regulator [Chitinimonas viridis]MDN3577173.1 LysR family transcriptional regulator [Chitinimonas viridis]